MSKTRKVYFEPEKQRVKWTQSSSDNFKYEYKYIGKDLDGLVNGDLFIL